MTRKDKIKRFFNLLSEYGYEVYDVQYGDGYFLFEFGKDTVAWFKVKGLRGWKFGVWLNTNSQAERKELFKKKYGNTRDYKWDSEFNYDLEFFFQYERDIDKFKPSASEYAFKICVDDYEVVKNYRPPFIVAMDLVKKHRQVARAGQDLNWRSSFSCFKSNFSLDKYVFISNFKKVFYRTTLFALLKLKYGKKCKIINNNPKGCDWYTTPEYEIECPITDKFYDIIFYWVAKAKCFIGTENIVE